MIKRGFALMFVLAFAFAGLVAGQEVAFVDSDVDAGTTPDSVVWGIDRAIERIELAMTFDKSDKENKRLENAYERLLEVRKMIEENKLDDAEKAREEHEKLLRTSGEEIEKLSDTDLDEVESLRNSIEAQETEVEGIVINAKLRESLNEDQKAKLDAFLASLGDDVNNVRVIIDEKEKNSLDRLERTGRNVSDIDQERIRLRERRIVRAEVLDDSSIVKIGYRFSTKIVERDALIKEIIERFELSEEDVKSMLKIESSDDDSDSDFDEDRLRIKVDMRERDGMRVSEVTILMRQGVDVVSEEEIRSAVVRLSRLSETDVVNALEIKERSNKTGERKIEIETRIRGNVSVSKIEIEWDGLRREIVLRDADRQEIIRSIALMLSASNDEVERAITKFETESEDDDTGDDDSDDDSDDESEDEDDSDDDSDDEEDNNRSGSDDSDE